MAAIPTSQACFSSKPAAALAAAALLLLPVLSPAGEGVGGQKIFQRGAGPRAGVFGRRLVVPFAPDGKADKTLALEGEAVEGALSPDGSRLALSLMNGGLVVAELDKAELLTVEDKEQCGNLGWGDDGTLHFTVSRIAAGAKEPAILIELRRLAPGAKKAAAASSFEAPLPPPPLPPPMPMLPGVPPGAAGAPAPGAPPAAAPPAAPPTKKR